ncbi:MAG: DUF1566 domain-containing protein [Bacteroidales bacterium]|nr:DUF1566 domain-containing protein [Bacteroidales bacterium]
MKKTITILMALMMLCFTQCKPTPEGGDENSRKVKVSCSIPMGKNNRSDFSELMTEGNVRWSDGRECVYLAIHGENPQIIELESWADGNPLSLEFEGEAAEGLIVSGEEYDIWYFGHSQQLETSYYNLSDDGSVLTGSIAAQSGRLEDLGYSHIATTKVTAVTESGEVKLNLKGTLANQIAIALLDLENVEELYGDAILGTEYTLSYNGERYELDVTEDNNAKIEVESASGISYVVLLPNDKKEAMIKHKKEDKTYAYTFHNGVKGNKVYYRTATNDKVALKWEEIEEEPETPTINGHEYVDLGLPSGLLWATCNVGAETPEAYGNYYAWGETTTKTDYSSSTSATYGLSYSTLQSQGYIDGEGNLTAQYDAAAANWGGDWRMPTKTEMQELINNCTWTWTTQNGVNGCKVTSKTNGNSIFLPAAGYRGGSSLYRDGSLGSYWSSTPNESDSNYANYLNFDSGNHVMYSYGRRYGLSVRPVSGGNNAEPEEPETPETPDNNNHEYVDLGLSVKWATCNVGAETPEGYGDYFAWGETTTKTNYSSSTSATYGLSISQLESQGYIDGAGNLNPQYDAAAANWGGDWRMPTEAEMRELIDNCTWTWTTQNGVKGYKVTSKVNSNYIFLPAAGRFGSSLIDAGSYGDYWSSTPYESISNYAYYLDFHGSDHSMRRNYRNLGRGVRPVLE